MCGNWLSVLVIELQYICRSEDYMAKKATSLEDIATEVGRLFGTTQAHAAKWLNQRQVLLEALSTVRDNASKLIDQIRGDGNSRPIRNLAGPLTDTPRKRRGRRKMSEATRAKMRAAATKRWAKKRKATK